MNSDVLREVTSVANKIGISPDVIIELMEEALTAVLEKQVGGFGKYKVTIDRDTGERHMFRVYEVVADGEVDDDEVAYRIEFSEAVERRPDIEVGEHYLEPVQDDKLSRIAAHHARHLIMRSVRRAEQMKLADAYRDRVGEILTGEVKRVTRDGVFVDLGSQIEAVVLREELIGREMLRPGDRIRAYLSAVEGDEENNPRLLLSRSCPEMLAELFALEVPEISENVINVMAVARDPGMRSKIVVKTNDGRIDPIGACVGMRGSRVQAVSSELNNERVDVILWSADPAELVINALAPAQVLSVTVNEEKHAMDIVVADDSLSQAIGRSGQNIRLASKITGWELNVMGQSSAEEAKEQAGVKLAKLFAEQLDVDEEIAEILVRDGFASIEAVAYSSIANLMAIDEFDEEVAELLKDRARQALIEAVVTSDGVDDDLKLSSVPGLTSELIAALNAADINDQDDLAEAAVDELTDLHEEINEENAAKWIMHARRRWFSEE